MKSSKDCHHDIGNAIVNMMHIIKHNLKPEALAEFKEQMARIEGCLRADDPPPPVDLHPLVDHLAASNRKLKRENEQLKIAMRLM